MSKHQTTRPDSHRVTHRAFRHSNFAFPANFGFRFSSFHGPRRGGYSFTEVMFAVIVLGIGFIMVAAVFPVAIQQSQATSEESVGASIARGAANYLQSIATNLTMPVTGASGARAAVAGFNGTDGWPAIRGNLILPDSPRFAWVAFYRREAGSPSAQVIIIPVQCRNRSSYNSEDPATEIDITPDVTAPVPAEQANLYGRNVTFTITNDGAGINIDTIQFDPAGINQYRAVAEGAYVVIAADGLSATDAGYFNGRIYRVGVRRADLDATVGGGTDEVWELSAGNDYIPEDPGTGLVTTLADATGFVVGREIVDPTAAPAAREYVGPAQDISVYTTFIQVR